MTEEKVYHFKCNYKRCGFTFNIKVLKTDFGRKIDVMCPKCFSRYEVTSFDDQILQEMLIEFTKVLDFVISTDSQIVDVAHKLRSAGINIDVGLALSIATPKPKRLLLRIDKKNKIHTKTMSKRDTLILRRMGIKVE